uniref:Uncharacterized protein n=1 Tax=Cannabis sativa TaxID=3483 RepID=A0A803NJQ5_CANSA
MVVTRGGIQTDPVNLIMIDPSIQTPRNARDPPRTNPRQVNTRPLTVGHGVTSPLAGFTLGIQETRNTSTAIEQTAPGTEVSSTINTQRPVEDDTELQNLRAALGLMQGHNNMLHHDQQNL